MNTAAEQMPGMNVRTVGQPEKPASWTESVVAMIPFLLVPMSLALAFALDLLKQVLRPSDSDWIIVISYVLWIILGGIAVIMSAPTFLSLARCATNTLRHV